MPSKAPSLKTVAAVPITPPGLLSVQDTLERHPDARKPLLEAEIGRRECEVVLLRSHRLLLRMELWNALQTAIIAGLVIFSFGVAFSGLVEIAKVVQRVGAWNATLAGNVLTRGFQGEIQNLIPSSTLLNVAHAFPFWDLGDATRLSVVIALIILGIRVAQGVFHWRASRRLKAGARSVEQEISVLRRWLQEK